jgi:GGDEF domain-containing protein
MSETSSIIKENIKNEHPEGVYSRSEVSAGKMKSALQLIKSNIPDLVNGELDLDQSVLDACMEATFFLGKLEELNFIITKGRKDVSDLAENIVTKVTEDVKNLLGEEIVSPEKLANVMKKNGKLIKTWIDVYMDKFAGQRFLEELSRQYNERLHIYGYDHFMTFMTRAVSNILVRLKKNSNENLQEDVKKLRSVATLFFDLDGLKMLNDMSLGGYNSGDKALWVMARALTNPALLSWAKSQKIELVPTHRSGDEFLLGVVAEDGVDLGGQTNNFTGVDGENVEGVSYLKYIGSYIKKTVQNFETIDIEYKGAPRVEELNKKKQPINPPKSIKDIIDFSNDEQREKFEEIKRKMPRELQEIFNEFFTYQLDCSYGYATLEDGLKSNIHGKIDFARIDHETATFELTGAGLANVASNKMKVDKKYSRLERAHSQELVKRVYEILYRAGREQRGWHIDEEDFAEIHKLLLEFRDEAKELKNKLKKEQRKVAVAERRAQGKVGVIEDHVGRIVEINKRKDKIIADLKAEHAYERTRQVNQDIDELNKLINLENNELRKQLRKMLDDKKNGK